MMARNITDTLTMSKRKIYGGVCLTLNTKCQYCYTHVMSSENKLKDMEIKANGKFLYVWKRCSS